MAVIPDRHTMWYQGIQRIYRNVDRGVGEPFWYELDVV